MSTPSLAPALPAPASPQLLQQIIERSPVGIATMDLEGRFLQVNPAYCTLYGYTEAELIGQPFTQVIAPDQRERAATLHRRFLTEGGVMRGEWRVVRRDGTLLNITAESVRVEGPDGAPRRLIFVRDLTELKAAQHRLDAERSRLTDLAATLPGAIFSLVVLGPMQWRYDYLSPGVEALYGIPYDQAMAGQGALLRAVVEEDRAVYVEKLASLISRREPIDHEFRIRTPDGTLKWIQAQGVPRILPSGETAWTGLLLDITDRKRIEADLADREERYRTLFETVPQGVVYQALDGRITSANPAAQRILGLTLDQMQGRTSIDPRWKAVREDGSDFPGDQHPAMEAIRTGQPVRDVIMGVHAPDRGHVWILVNATPLFRNAVLHEVYASFEDITERHELAAELKRQATTDFLTGAANRRQFEARLEEAFERLRRHPESPLSVVVFDLDHFKRVNDTYGHAAGDEVLRHVVRVASAQIRRVDLLGRMGGEEFAVLLPDTDIDNATVLAERIRRAVEAATLTRESGPIAVTLSLGVSAFRADDVMSRSALVRADRALYRVKAGGRNAVAVEPAGGPETPEASQGPAAS